MGRGLCEGREELRAKVERAEPPRWEGGDSEAEGQSLRDWGAEPPGRRGRSFQGRRSLREGGAGGGGMRAEPPGKRGRSVPGGRSVRGGLSSRERRGLLEGCGHLGRRGLLGGRSLLSGAESPRRAEPRVRDSGGGARGLNLRPPHPPTAFLALRLAPQPHDPKPGRSPQLQPGNRSAETRRCHRASPGLRARAWGQAGTRLRAAGRPESAWRLSGPGRGPAAAATRPGRRPPAPLSPNPEPRTQTLRDRGYPRKSPRSPAWLRAASGQRPGQPGGQQQLPQPPAHGAALRAAAGGTRAGAGAGARGAVRGPCAQEQERAR